MIIRIIFYLSVCLLCGCATTPSGPPFAHVLDESGRYATLYFIRPKDGYGTLVAPEVLVDGKLIASLGYGGYTYTLVGPGKRTVSTKGSPMTVPHWIDPQELFVEKGKRYFVQLVNTFDRTNNLGITPTGSVYFSPSMKNIEHRWKIIEGANESEVRAAGLSDLRLIVPSTSLVD